MNTITPELNAHELITPELMTELNTLAVHPHGATITVESLENLRAWINEIYETTHAEVMNAKKNWIRTSDELYRLQNAKNPNKNAIAEKIIESDEWHEGFLDQLDAFLNVRAFEEIMRVMPEVFSGEATPFQERWFVNALRMVPTWRPVFPKFV